jgi:hypothetical protein
MPRMVKREYEWLVVIRINDYQYWMEPLVGSDSREIMQAALNLPHLITRAPRDLGDPPNDLTISVRVIKTTDQAYSKLKEELQFDDRAILVDYADGQWLSLENNNLIYDLK